VRSSDHDDDDADGDDDGDDHGDDHDDDGDDGDDHGHDDDDGDSPTGCIGKLGGGFDIPRHGPPALDGLSCSWDQQPNWKPSTRSDD
jgi:hypothetical protein